MHFLSDKSLQYLAAYFSALLVRVFHITLAIPTLSTLSA
jgi:hypothetical protein